MDKNLQKTYLSFFHIMLQFFSRDPGDENQLDSGLWFALNGFFWAEPEELQCTIGQGTSYTYCSGTDSTGSSVVCDDSTGNQITQERTEGDIDCSGLDCYDDQSSLFGVCETIGNSHRYGVDRCAHAKLWAFLLFIKDFRLSLINLS